MKVPSWSRRFKVGLDWAWDLVFARDLSHLKPNMTERVSGAYFQPGDYVFRQGDPALNFYVIEKGEAEVVRRDPDTGKEEIVSVLGPGAFFGEMALIGNKQRNASIRARSPLEVTVMGRNVFTQVSESLRPLKDLIARTVARRTSEVWQRLPSAREVLERTPLSEFMDPPPQPLLQPDQGFEQALAADSSLTPALANLVNARYTLCEWDGLEAYEQRLIATLDDPASDPRLPPWIALSSHFCVTS